MTHFIKLGRPGVFGAVVVPHCHFLYEAPVRYGHSGDC